MLATGTHFAQIETYPDARSSTQEIPVMYIGPDALMPLASAFAAIAGVALMFWRRLVGAVRLLAAMLANRVFRRRTGGEA